MLRNTLQPLYSAVQVEEALSAVGVRRDARAQELSVEQFAALFVSLQTAVASKVLDGEDV
jgi:16S rRNA A1518/A1519 N6-dimethyltransferase RsmA/KsgA/DIM1 with predicted DNA glycosylase/AP lyase activity